METGRVDLHDYLRVLRLRWRLITTCVLLAIGAAAAVTVTSTPVYEASTQLFVSASGDAGISSIYTGSLFTQQRVVSYAQFVNSPTVTAAVIQQLGLTSTPAAVAAEISTDVPLNTVLLNIHVKDTSPARAQAIANATATQFGKLVQRIEAPGTAGAPTVRISVVRSAGLPSVPVSPRKKLNLALGLLVGLAIGVGGAVLRETLDTRVRSAAELEERFQLPTLAVVAYDAAANHRPLIVQENPRSMRAEAFRRLRTNLQFVDVDHQPTSIVITSAVTAEGKTTTASNLAVALSEAGVPVILLEGDLRRPSLARYLGLEGAVGLTDVLVGRVDLDDALHTWGSTGAMQVLLCGAIPPNPSELLGSQQMIDLLARLEQRALVLIDAPPLLPVTDAAILSTIASGAVLVVHDKATRREHVATALETLKAVGGHVYGAVLNMAPTRGPDAYDYGYSYGDGAARSRRSTAKDAATFVPARPDRKPSTTPATTNPAASAAPAADPTPVATPPDAEFAYDSIPQVAAPSGYETGYETTVLPDWPA